MQERVLNGTATFTGNWFLPEHEDDKARHIPGLLEWKEKRGKLSLSNLLTGDLSSPTSKNPTRYPAIHGTTSDSNYVSLLDTHESYSHLTLGQAGLKHSEEHVTSWVIIGALVTSETMYSEVTFRIPGLQTWICNNQIEWKLEKSEECKYPTTNISLPGHDEKSIQIEESDITVELHIARKHYKTKVHDVHIELEGFITLSSTTPIPLITFIDEFSKYRKAISLIAGSPMGTDKIKGKTSTGYEVEILVALRDSATCPFTEKSNFFLAETDLSISLNEVFNTWNKHYSHLSEPSNLAVSLLSSEDLWLHVEFLIAMQALEGFHRSQHSGLYTSPEEYSNIERTLKEAIPKSVEPSHKESLKSRIRYGNEISLRKRLDELTNTLTSELRELIFPLAHKFPNKWVDARNYYTHWDTSSGPAPMSPREMINACLRLRVLIRVLYLQLLGIPQKDLEHILKRSVNDEATRLQQLNIEEHHQQGM